MAVRFLVVKPGENTPENGRIEGVHGDNADGRMVQSKGRTVLADIEQCAAGDISGCVLIDRPIVVHRILVHLHQQAALHRRGVAQADRHDGQVQTRAGVDPVQGHRSGQALPFGKVVFHLSVQNIVVCQGLPGGQGVQRTADIAGKAGEKSQHGGPGMAGQAVCFHQIHRHMFLDTLDSGRAIEVGDNHGAIAAHRGQTGNERHDVVYTGNQIG